MTKLEFEEKEQIYPLDEQKNFIDFTNVSLQCTKITVQVILWYPKQPKTQKKNSSKVKTWFGSVENLSYDWWFHQGDNFDKIHELFAETCETMRLYLHDILGATEQSSNCLSWWSVCLS